MQPTASTTTHNLYAHIPWERQATARCYQCGTEMPARYLIWMQHPEADAYLALCGPCHGDDLVDMGNLVGAPRSAAVTGSAAG
jgi:cytochrome c553